MYIKPMILDSDDIPEGIFAASGDPVAAETPVSCYTVTANIHQTPEVGRGDYRIQVNAKHNADHTREAQLLTISFNQPVTFKDASGGVMTEGNGTNTLKIQYWYHQNPIDNIGLGDLIVEADQGLAITAISMTD